MTHVLEQRAQQTLGDAIIDDVFAAVSARIGERVWAGISAYVERMTTRDPEFDSAGVNAGIAIDVLQAVKRDVAWAVVEQQLASEGFFSDLLQWYARGRWPCGWIDGSPPQGRVLVV